MLYIFILLANGFPEISIRILRYINFLDWVWSRASESEAVRCLSEAGGGEWAQRCLETSSCPDATTQKLINTAAGRRTCRFHKPREEKAVENREKRKTRNNQKVWQRTECAGRICWFVCEQNKETGRMSVWWSIWKILNRKGSRMWVTDRLQPFTRKSHTPHSEKQGLHDSECRSPHTSANVLNRCTQET